MAQRRGGAAGYVAIVGLIFLTFQAYLLMGTRWTFQYDSYRVTTLWLVVSFVLSLLAALVGGLVAAKLGRTRRSVIGLMGLVLVLGFLMAGLEARSPDKGPFARDSETSSMEAMQNARQPFWVMLVNPLLGALGVWLGGSLAGIPLVTSSAEDREAMSEGLSTSRRWHIRTRTLLILVAVLAVPLALHFEQKHYKEQRSRLRHAMIAAAQEGETETVRELLQLGADVDSVTNGRYPWTPLMEAAFRGHLDTVTLLVRHRADLNHTDLDAFSAITLAAGEDHWEIVKLLAAHGADLSQRDGYGETAVGYAEKAERRDVVVYLKAVEAVHQRGSLEEP